MKKASTSSRGPVKRAGLPTRVLRTVMGIAIASLVLSISPHLMHPLEMLEAKLRGWRPRN